MMSFASAKIKSKPKSKTTHSGRPAGLSSEALSLPYPTRSPGPRLGAYYACGPAVGFSSPPPQAKLTIGKADDPFEREADAVADRITSGQSASHVTPISSGALQNLAGRQETEETEHEEIPSQTMLVQRQEVDDEEEASPISRTIQRRTIEKEIEPEEQQTSAMLIRRQEADNKEGTSNEAPMTPDSIQRQKEEANEDQPDQRMTEEEKGQVHGKLQAQQFSSTGRSCCESRAATISKAISTAGAGDPLQPAIKNRMETGLGLRLGNVRVHSDGVSFGAAKALKARAFTQGGDIWLGAGQSKDDAHLMAHEITHVAQQNSGQDGFHTLQLKNQDALNESDNRDKDLNVLSSTMAINRNDDNTLRNIDNADESLSEEELARENVRQPGDSTNKSQPSSNRHNAVLEQELVAATANSRAQASRTEGGPTVLELGQSPPRQPASRPPIAPDPPVQISAPAPGPDTEHIESKSQDIIQQSLPAGLNGNQSDVKSIESINPTIGTPLQDQDNSAIDTPPSSERDDESDGEADPGSVEQTAAEALASTAPPEPGGAGGPVVGDQAGIALVPQPQPEMLASKIPEREPTFDEFMAIVDAERSEEQDRAEVQQMLISLRSEAASEKTLINTEAETHKAEILAKKESQVVSVQAAMNVQASSIRALFTNTRTNLIQTLESNKAVLETETINDSNQVETETFSRISEVENGLTQRQADLTGYAEQQRQQPPLIAQEEANRAERELERAAREAEDAGEAEARRYPGSEDPKPDQRAAALEVGRDSAADIRAKKPEISADLLSRSNNFSGQYLEYAETVNGRISSTMDQLITSLQEFAESAKVSLQQSKQASLQAMERRFQVDLQGLDTAESTALSKLRIGGEKAISQIHRSARQASGEIDAASSALVMEIDNNLEEIETVISPEQDPFLPGVNDIVEASRGSILDISTRGRSQLTASTLAALNMLDGIVSSFSSQAEGIFSTAQESADSVRQNANNAQQQTIDSRRQTSQQTLAALASQQEQVISQVLAEVDSSIEEARGEIRGINTRFRADIREAADESIREAIKPRTDDTESRAHAAAVDAGKSWWEGLLSAIGQIVIGLVILVAVALVVAAIAAAFGVILTAWTAIMIAGAILLAFGLILSIINRSNQWDQFEGSTIERVGKVVGLALLDTVGGTGIYEGFSGTDIVTGRELSDAEQTERGVLGWFTAITLVLGARAAIKGPPGGAYVRPMSLRPSGFKAFFRGWRGWRIGGLKAYRNGRLILGDMYHGMRQGIRDIGEWVRTRILRRDPTRLPPDIVERAGNISDAETRRGGPDPYAERGPAGELPYETPPETHVVRPGEPLNISRLDPSKRYLWVLDPEGNFIIAPESQAGFAPLRGRSGRGRPGVVKHGDLTPGVEGQYRGAARAGGELNFRNGQWVMDHNSSYGFARTDQARLGRANLDAAYNALRRTGTDTGNIKLDYRYSDPITPPVRRGAAPTPPVQTPTPRDIEEEESQSSNP